MRLGGKIRDYYDGGLTFGRDEDLYFHRESVSGPISIAEDLATKLNDVIGGDRFGVFIRQYSTSGDCLTVEVIGFCGKLYPYVRLNTEGVLVDKLPRFNECFYTRDNFNRLDQILAQENMQRVKNSVLIRTDRFSRTLGYEHIQKSFEALRNINMEHVFIEHRVPYFRVKFHRNYNEDSVTLVPVLADSQFYKVKDPYTAFQEISMYLGGVIPRQAPEMVEVSDKDRIVQHGFNKLSFRHPIKLSKVSG